MQKNNPDNTATRSQIAKALQEGVFQVFMVDEADDRADAIWRSFWVELDKVQGYEPDPADVERVNAYLSDPTDN